MCCGKEFLFEPHLNLNQHDTKPEGKQRQSIWDHKKKPEQRKHHLKVQLDWDELRSY
jgi:hypothetical protein